MSVGSPVTPRFFGAFSRWDTASPRFVSCAVTANGSGDGGNGSGSIVEGSPGTLEDDVGPEVYKELRAAFLSHLVSQRGELSEAVEHEDIASAQGVAHQLIGTASSFGAAHLDGLARQVLEMDGDDRQLLRSLVGEIDAEIDALRAGVGV